MRLALALWCCASLAYTAACAPAPQPTPTSASVSATAAPQPTPIPRSGSDHDLILATTTSTQDSGLLDVLVPLFQDRTGYQVKTVSVGTGAALALGARGEADVVLVHAPASEAQWMAQGNGTRRLLVMHNDYHVMPVNPAKFPGVPINATGGQAFADFLVAPDTQQVIANFGRDKFGQSLFVPDAGKSESDLGL